MYTNCCSIQINTSFMSLSKPKYLQNIATRLLKQFLLQITLMEKRNNSKSKYKLKTLSYIKSMINILI